MARGPHAERTLELLLLLWGKSMISAKADSQRVFFLTLVKCCTGLNVASRLDYVCGRLATLKSLETRKNFQVTKLSCKHQPVMIQAQSKLCLFMFFYL